MNYMHRNWEEEIPFKSILDQTTDIVIVTAVEPLDEPFGPKIIYVNQAFTGLTGYTKEEVLGKTPRILQGEKTDKKTLRQIRVALEKKEAIHVELLNYAKDQSEYWLNFTIIPIKDNNGYVKYFAAIEHDITERKKREEARSTLSTLVEFSDEAIIGKNLEGTILSWNKGAQNLYGYTDKEVIGLSIKILFPKNKHEEFQNIMQKIASNKKIKHYETIRVHKDGHVIPVSMTITPVKNAQGDLLGASEIARDVTQQKLIEAKLKHLAEHDSLTGLINRPLFENRLTQAILLTKQQKNNVAVCFLDVDNFKKINDIYGHAMGDLLLCNVVKRIQKCLRESDTLARFGGDEFGLILSVSNEDEVIKITKRILQNFSKKLVIKNNRLKITISIGVSLYPKDKQELIEKADAAMYYVKNHGKNNFKLFDNNLQY